MSSLVTPAASLLEISSGKTNRQTSENPNHANAVGVGNYRECYLSKVHIRTIDFRSCDNGQKTIYI